MKRRHTKPLQLLALILCAALLFHGPAYPMTVFAAVGVEDDEEPENLEEETGGDEEPPPAATSSSSSSSSVGGKYQDQIDSITARQKELQAEKAIIEKDISKAKSEKEKELANKSHIDRQIYITQEEITLLQERIAVLEQDIEEKINDIEEKQAEYDTNYAQFLKRLRSMQLSGEASQLGAILGSSDFADYLATNEMMGRIAEYDQRLMQRVKEERIALEQEKEDLEDVKEQVEVDRMEMEGKKKTLAGQQQAALLKIQDIDQLQREFEANLAENQKLQKQMQAELDKIYAQIEWDKNPYRGGEMLWPVPGYYNISSAYGWRWGKSDFHTGIDISGGGIYGKPIVAANDGRVAYTNTSYVTGRGYGIYLIIDHGGGISTLYGHCSQLLVSTGQEVKKGDQVALIGSTGWSTGPHLHFEVREDSYHVPPTPYLTAK